MTTSIILWTLLRTTLVLTFCGGICFLALRKIENRLPKLSRLLWLAVLLTGWFWLQPVIEIPYTHLAGTPAQEAVGNRPPGDCVGDSRLEAENATIDVNVIPSAEYRTLPPGGRQPTPAPPIAHATEYRLSDCLLAIYLTGMFITIFWAASGYIRILWSLRKTEFAEDALAAPWKKLLTEHGIKRTVPMLVSHNLGPALVRMPLGYRLVVPSELWSELSASGRQGILKHELAHFRRRDVWKSFFVRILTLPHWFNPVAHYAANRFDELAEQLCDREAFTGKREGISEFARILLLMHENAPTHFVARQSLFGRNLQRRVASLLEPPHFERTSTMKKTLLVIGTAAILFVALFRVEFVAQERETADGRPQTTAEEQTESVELRLTVTDEDKRPLPGSQVELIYGADNLYSLRFETGADGVGIINIPIAAASAETQGVVIAPGKGMTQGFSLWEIPKDWEPSKPLEMTIPVYKRTRVLTGTVVDSDGKAVAGALVGDSFASPLMCTQTDENGRFEYYRYERPIETLFAFKEGVGGAAISPDFEEAEKWKAMDERVEEWRKREKHNNGPFTLKLTKGSPISVQVVNHEGNPVEGAWVTPTSFSTDSRFTKEIRSWNAWNLPRLWGKKTDAHGMVQFDSVPTEGFDMVTFDAFGDDPRFVKESKSKQFGNGSAIWRLQANNNELVISLPRRILIEGSVRNADGTPPSSGMQISVSGLTGWSSAGTHMDYAGNFTFFVNANEVISVQPIYNSSRDPKGGVAPARLNVPVGKGWGEPPAPRFDFVLEKGTQVKGKIIAKEAFSQTYIQVYDDAAGTGEMTEMSWRFIVIDINEQGEFDMRLPNGRYRFKVRFQTADGEWGDKIIAKPLVINGEDEVRFDLEI